MFWVRFFKCDLRGVGMCLAIPGKVVEIEVDNVVVDYVTEKRKVKTLLDVRVGDYVIVSNGVIADKVLKEEAENFLGMLG
jgi:hydrogenase assembly chaperone HypC/HupF